MSHYRDSFVHYQQQEQQQQHQQQHYQQHYQQQLQQQLQQQQYSNGYQHQQQQRPAPPLGGYPTFDLFFDLPHPAASSGSASARVIEVPPSDQYSEFSHVDELYEPDNIARIARFAFPEHDDQLHAASVSRLSNDANDGERSGAGLNRHDVYFYAFAPQQYTFLLQLSNGVRVHGHVRRYLPPHPEAPFRHDVGRRGPRAMVLLTRAPSGERFYASLLKTLEIVSIRSTVGCRGGGGGVSNNDHDHDDDHHEEKDVNPVQTFLFTLQRNHERLIRDYYEDVDGDRHEDYTKLTVEGGEYGPHSPLLSLDRVSFRLPPTLQPEFTGYYSAEDLDSPVLPLLRCLCASHVTRLLSALLCERRIIMISRRSSRLSACVRGASSLLAQGLLVWQHLLVPILPPHLERYLVARTPYLIGVLESSAQSIEILPNMGEVLCVNLDSDSMTTYYTPDPARWVPDLLAQGRWRTKNVTAPELLAQDLDDVAKADRRMWAERKHPKDDALSDGHHHHPPSYPHHHAAAAANNGNNGGESSGSSSTSRRSLFFNPFRGMGLVTGASSKKMSESTANDDAYDAMHVPGEGAAARIEWECCENEKAEESVRVALTAFYLYLFGDMGMYLSQSPKDGSLYFDRKKYLQCKILQGVKEDSNLFSVVQTFSRTELFAQFVRRRIDELHLEESERRRCRPRHRSLFSMCETFMRVNTVYTSVEKIRVVVQRQSENCPQREVAHTSDVVRGKALSLTSKQNFEGNALRALASLIETSSNVNSSLCDVFGVVWIRTKDARPHLWRHPLLALYILRNMLLHGPVTAIAEAYDGIEIVRALRNYQAHRASDNAFEVRAASEEIYDLLVNRHVLFAQRRQLACRRLRISASRPDRRWADYLVRRLPVTVPFAHIHGLLKPDRHEKGMGGGGHHHHHHHHHQMGGMTFGGRPPRRQSSQRSGAPQSMRSIGSSSGSGGGGSSVGRRNSAPSSQRRRSRSRSFGDHDHDDGDSRQQQQHQQQHQQQQQQQREESRGELLELVKQFNSSVRTLDVRGWNHTNTQDEDDDDDDDDEPRLPTHAEGYDDDHDHDNDHDDDPRRRFSRTEHDEDDDDERRHRRRDRRHDSWTASRDDDRRRRGSPTRDAPRAVDYVVVDRRAADGDEVSRVSRARSPDVDERGLPSDLPARDVVVVLPRASVAARASSWGVERAIDHAASSSSAPRASSWGTRPPSHDPPHRRHRTVGPHNDIRLLNQYVVDDDDDDSEDDAAGFVWSHQSDDAELYRKNLNDKEYAREQQQQQQQQHLIHNNDNNNNNNNQQHHLVQTQQQYLVHNEPHDHDVRYHQHDDDDDDDEVHHHDYHEDEDHDDEDDEDETWNPNDSGRQSTSVENRYRETLDRQLRSEQQDDGDDDDDDEEDVHEPDDGRGGRSPRARDEDDDDSARRRKRSPPRRINLIHANPYANEQDNYVLATEIHGIDD